MPLYEVTLSNLVTAADNPIEAVTQFCVLNKIPPDIQDSTVFSVKDVDTGKEVVVEEGKVSCYEGLHFDD